MKISAINYSQQQKFVTQKSLKHHSLSQKKDFEARNTTQPTFKGDKGALIGMAAGAATGLGAALLVVATGGLAAAVAAVGVAGVAGASAGAGAQVGGIIGGLASDD